MAVKRDEKKEKELFSQVSSAFLDYDPAHFIQNNLTLDGEPFSVLDNGWKFMADIYRYIALQATKKSGKSVVICKGRQVGATMMAGALDLFFTNSGMFCKPPIRVAHLFPVIKLAQRFSQDKLEGLVRSSREDFINKNKLEDDRAADNMTMKQFKTGTLWVESLGDDGDRIRGMTLDVIFFDEVQDMVGQSIGNATKTLTAAKYGPIANGVQVYFGTPKQRDSFFNKIWELSNKQYYHLGCKNCKQTYPFYMTGDNSWEKIWIHTYIVKCPLCGTEQPKVDAIELGEWVSSKDEEDCKYVGFHVNQLYIPYITKEKIMDLMPDKNPEHSEREWNNEVLGEFYSGIGLPLTKEDIYNNCRDADRSFSTRISPNDKQAYLGMDWGGKVDNDELDRGQSFSCAVILSAQPDGVLLVEHAHKLKDTSFTYKKETIKELYKRFAIRRGVADYFYGQDVVKDVQAIYMDKFLGAQGSGSLLVNMKYRPEELIIGYNKDLLIEEIFDKLRRGLIRFPWKSIEKMDWLIDHCTSMETGIRMIGGQQIKTYKKGYTPNDGLMALMYAYMAYKFELTKAFTIKPGTQTGTTMPKPSLAYAPKLR